jgi:hypothetical protein
MSELLKMCGPAHRHEMAIRVKVFRAGTRGSFRVEKGLVVLSDESRLVWEILAFIGEATTLVGSKVAARVLGYLLEQRCGLSPSVNQLEMDLARLIGPSRDAAPLEDLIRRCVAASAFPRLNQGRVTRLNAGS